MYDQAENYFITLLNLTDYDGNFGFYREHEKLNLLDHATVCLLLKGLHCTKFTIYLF